MKSWNGWEKSAIGKICRQKCRLWGPLQATLSYKESLRAEGLRTIGIHAIVDPARGKECKADESATAYCRRMVRPRTF